MCEWEVCEWGGECDVCVTRECVSVVCVYVGGRNGT